GSTDMGDVSHVIPAIHPMVKFVENGADAHTIEFKEASIKPFAYDMLINGAKAMAMTSLEILKNPDILIKIKEDFNKS
ncbi:MAG: M20 family peptidase, partial [Intestinibacter sp.]